MYTARTQCDTGQGGLLVARRCRATTARGNVLRHTEAQCKMVNLVE